MWTGTTPFSHLLQPSPLAVSFNKLRASQRWCPSAFGYRRKQGRQLASMGYPIGAIGFLAVVWRHGGAVSRNAAARNAQRFTVTRAWLSL